jgi:hypothetical protein
MLLFIVSDAYCLADAYVDIDDWCEVLFHEHWVVTLHLHLSIQQIKFQGHERDWLLQANARSSGP